MAEPTLSLAEAAARLGISPAVLSVVWQQQDLPTSGAEGEWRFDVADVERLRAKIASKELSLPEDYSALESIRAAASDLPSDDVAVVGPSGQSPTDSQVLFDDPVQVNVVGGSQTVVVEGAPGSSGREVRVEPGHKADGDSKLLGGEDDDPDSHSKTLQGDARALIAEEGAGEPDSVELQDPVLHDDIPLVGIGDGSQTDISVDTQSDDFLDAVSDDAAEIAVEGGGPPSSQQRDIHEVLMGPGERPGERPAHLAGKSDVFGGGTVIGDVPEDSGQDIDVNIRDFGDFGREEDPFGPEDFGASGIEGFGGSFLPGKDEPHPFEGVEDDELPLPFDSSLHGDDGDDDLTDSILALDDSSGSVDNLGLPGDSLQGTAPRAVTPPDFDSSAGRPLNLDLGELDELDALDVGNSGFIPSNPSPSGRRDSDPSLDPAANAGRGDGREMSINFDAGGSGVIAKAGGSPFDLGSADDFGAFDTAEPPSRGPDDILSTDEAHSDLLSDGGSNSDLRPSDVPSGLFITDADLANHGPSSSGLGPSHDVGTVLGEDESHDEYGAGVGARGSSGSGADLDLLDLAAEADDGSYNSAVDEGTLATLDDGEDEDALTISPIAGGSGVQVGDDITEGLTLTGSSRSIDVGEDFNDEIVSVSEITTADELAPSDSGLTVIDEEPRAGSMVSLDQDDDDEFVLGGSTGSDITLAANESGIGIGSGLSGIGLAAMSGSGIDLATSSGFETSPSSVTGGAGSHDQEFLLQPLEAEEGDESDSGSQVIALDPDSVDVESAPTMLGADPYGADPFGGPTMLGGDPYGAAPAADPLGALPTGGMAQPGYAPTPGIAPVVYETAGDGISFTGGDAALLSTIFAMMALSAILMFDVMRAASMGSQSAILKWVFSLVG